MLKLLWPECQTDDWKQHKKFCKELKDSTWLPATISRLRSEGNDKVAGEPPPNIHAEQPFLAKFTFGSADESKETKEDTLITLVDRQGGLCDVVVGSPPPSSSKGKGKADANGYQFVYDAFIADQAKATDSAEVGDGHKDESSEQQNNELGQAVAIIRWAMRTSPTELTICVDKEPGATLIGW